MALYEDMKKIEKFVYENCVDRKDIDTIKNKIIP